MPPDPPRQHRPLHSPPATGAGSLAHAVEVAVRAVDDTRLVPVAPLDAIASGTARGLTSLIPVAPVDAGVALQPRTLLALLAYCYARQIYCSADIEACLRRDPNFCQLCHGTFPDARTLRRFRRENREALLLCLKAALRFVAEQKVAQGVVTRFHEAHLAEEANRRIIMAMFTDSMELDKDQTADSPVDLCYLFANGRARAH